MPNAPYIDGNLTTGITIPDVKRALLNGGDVSFLMPVLGRALNNPPVKVAPSLEVPLLLPEADRLLTDKGKIGEDLERTKYAGKTSHRPILIVKNQTIQLK